MANIKVSEMTEATVFDDGDYAMIVQANQNKKILKENMLSEVGDLSNLETIDKSDIVNSINEVNGIAVNNAKDNQYSQTEIDTGKVWLNNKTIYKKTLVYNVTGSTTTDISELNIENVIDYNSICHRYGNNNDDYEKPYYSGTNDYFRCFLRLNNNTIETRITISSGYNTYQIITTIYYTKND